MHMLAAPRTTWREKPPWSIVEAAAADDIIHDEELESTPSDYSTTAVVHRKAFAVHEATAVTRHMMTHLQPPDDWLTPSPIPSRASPAIPGPPAEVAAPIPPEAFAEPPPFLAESLFFLPCRTKGSA